jgi:hypothetical protein
MVALRHGYDFVQTLGFLVLNFGNIFYNVCIGGAATLRPQHLFSACSSGRREGTS